MVKVLFICTGNICRSPTAEGVFRALVQHAGLASEIEIDSAGTGAWHVGEPPDPRSQAAAAERGIDLSSQQARQFAHADVEAFDYLIAMDTSNIDALHQVVPAAARAKLSLFLEFAPGVKETDVPDPYYGGGNGFDFVLDLVEEASRELLSHIQRTNL